MSDECISSCRLIPFTLTLRTEFFLERLLKMHFSPKNGWNEKLMTPSKSAPQELSNEWSCQ
jgi:hypothetical protein